MLWPHLLLALHLTGVIVWVGGMAFAYTCLRPAAMALEPPQRLTLWVGVFRRFFPQVWIAVILILGSGLSMILRVGFAAAPPGWHLMFAIGLLMMAIFAYVWFVPWPRLQRAVAQAAWPAGGTALAQIRKAVAVNLGLGLTNVAVATLGLLL
ncbi:MAG: CopD family protein [Rhodocyclaceae bacterium]|nr:CopD family protein [Rhodocyclaceae bacterium]